MLQTKNDCNSINVRHDSRVRQINQKRNLQMAFWGKNGFYNQSLTYTFIFNRSLNHLRYRMLVKPTLQEGKNTTFKIHKFILNQQPSLRV
ncbi:hypothetical protein V6Z11_D02G074800 [Gossypium hirsutum]